MVEPMVKGSTIYRSKQMLRRVFGQKTLDSIFLNCKPKTRQMFTKLVSPNEWYPEKNFADFLFNIQKEIGSETFDRYCREEAKHHLNTVLRFFLRIFISPQKFAENNKKLWDALHNSGNLEVVLNERNKHDIKITDFDFINSAYMDAFVNYHIAIIEVTGGKDVKGSCLKTGKNTYFLKFSWN